MSIESVMPPTISSSAAKTPHRKDPSWLCLPCMASAELKNTWRSRLGNWSPEKGSAWPRVRPLLVAKPAIDPGHAERRPIVFHRTCSLHKYQVSTLSPWYFYSEAKRRNRIIFTFTSLLTIQFSSVTQSCPIMRPHGLQHARLTHPLPTPRTCSNSCPSSRWYHLTISSSVIPFSFCLQSFPESGSFQMSQFFASGGQSIGVSASASVLPMKFQDWFPLGLTGWISLQSKGLSRVFSNITVQKHQFFSAQLSS